MLNGLLVLVLVGGGGVASLGTGLADAVKGDEVEAKDEPCETHHKNLCV